MEARVTGARIALVLCAWVVVSGDLQAATYRTKNFVVSAPTADFAERVGQEAERYRKELAMMWAGKELPNWSAPCPIKCKVGQIGAGGATTFNFQNGEVLGWRMNIQGTEVRILDSVLPHEITHTILACIFRRPLPRWADEGMSTLIEHESERRRQTRLLNDVMRSSSKIPLQSLLSMKEYPSNPRDVMKLYAQGYSLTDYLVQQGGRQTFLKFLQDAHRHGSWDHALSAHYGVNSIQNLEQKWDKWVIAGSPRLNQPEGTKLALNDRADSRNSVVRGQSPEKKQAAAPAPVTDSNRAPRNTAEQLAQLESPRGGNRSRAGEAQPTAMASRTEAEQTGSTHQASRSRSHLTQPVYIQRVNHGQNQNTVQRRSRNNLKMTREGLAAPSTLIHPNKDGVHPFGSNGQKDPFTP